jgi:hypothetical protein
MHIHTKLKTWIARWWRYADVTRTRSVPKSRRAQTQSNTRLPPTECRRALRMVSAIAWIEFVAWSSCSSRTNRWRRRRSN